MPPNTSEGGVLSIWNDVNIAGDDLTPTRRFLALSSVGCPNWFFVVNLNVNMNLNNPHPHGHGRKLVHKPTRKLRST